MCRQLICFVMGILTLCLFASPAFAQFGGSRAGVEPSSETVPSLPVLEREVVEGFIAIDGRAEVRVRPTEIRIVLAVTAEGPTARECDTSIQEIMLKLKNSWGDMGIPAEGIVEDFIAVLPLYQWELEERGTSEIGVEKKVGFRMQTNVHLAVPNDADAAKALTKAFEQGVTDIIAFDYWNKELDDFKRQAQELAVKAARSKSELLFTAVFDAAPPVVNVQEKTTVRYPESLYQSFVNSYAEELQPSWRRDIPFIRAYRPRNTYYRGLFSDGDVQPRELPMHPEISVVSDVRLYFESPMRKTEKKGGMADDK